jgi:aldehyde:ferredoxin oxidoreductase
MVDQKSGMKGRVLRVDLTLRQFSMEELSQADLKCFLGGRGLGAALLYRELPPKVDPLGEENLLIFSTGPLAATSAPCSSRFCLTTKSPLTGFYLFSISGGYFGPILKKAGVDVLVIKGRASRPTTLLVREDGVEFKDASGLWGMTTDHTQEFIKSEFGDSVGVTCIGPAGENLVPYACLINERRALGRGGGGAVMGSKNLKAIVVQGTRRASVADEDRFRPAVKRAFDEIQKNPITSKTFPKYGSASWMTPLKEFGITPCRNWQIAPPPEIEKITFESIRDDFVVKDMHCAPPCPIKCSKLTLVHHDQFAGWLTEGPEYETIYAFGSCCGVYDGSAIIAADNFCDRYGLDTISAGVTIAFAMECYERGLIDERVAEGMELTFGNKDVLLPLLHKIAYQKGIGRMLAQGTRKMAEEIGKGTEAFAMHAKGMELGGYDPRGVKGMALVYACGPRGGCHHAGGFTVLAEVLSGKFDRFSEQGKAKLVKETRDKRTAAFDSGMLCAFTAAALGDGTIAEMISAATGIPLSVADLYTLGERIGCVERAFNVREGLTPELDTLPGRLLNEVLSEGPNRGQRIDLNTLRREFYQECGWDEVTGLPKKEKLRELGLDGMLRE